MTEINTTKWLRYLLYVGIAATVNSILSLFLPAVSTWLSPILSLAAMFMMSRMIPANGRYLRVILFTGVSLVITVFSIQAVALAGSICSLVGQYQEYTAHGELVAAQNPKLASRWGSLFWFQFAVTVILVLVTTVLGTMLAVAANMDAVLLTSIVTVIVAVFTLILQIVYLVFLHRTIRVLDAEIVG